MIFVTAVTEPTVFLFLTEQDVNDIRGGGRTKFVDERATGGATFNKVVVAVCKNDEEALDWIRRSGNKIPEHLAKHEPKPDEGKCTGCNSICGESLLLGGKCIACWKEKAELYERIVTGGPNA